MSLKNAAGHLAWMIGTWVLFYAILCLAKVNNAKQITLAFMLINLLLFPFSIEHIATGQYYPSGPINSIEILLYIGLFYFFGPMSIVANIRFIYFMLVGG
jgi:hypothetical protein